MKPTHADDITAEVKRHIARDAVAYVRAAIIRLRHIGYAEEAEALDAVTPALARNR